MMRTHRQHVKGDLHARTIATLLRLVLQLNNFEFNGQRYLETEGKAMGTRVAPTFANLFMAIFEPKHVYSYPLRFIDDVFMIWNHGQQALDLFVLHLNQAHPTIKFTMEASPERVHFLDMWLIKEDRLYTDLFVKPNDSAFHLSTS